MTETDISSSELKKEIRRKMLALRRALSDDEAVQKADRLTEQILSLPEYKKAKRIMAFLAMKGESNLDRLITLALSEGKEVYVPVCLPKRQMEAGRLLDMDHFVKGPLGLRDLPKGYDTIAPEELDLVLVPGVACDGRETVWAWVPVITTATSPGCLWKRGWLPFGISRWWRPFLLSPLIEKWQKL